MTIDLIKQILEKNQFDKTDALEYTHSPYCEDFQNITEFYNETIKLHEQWGIKPSIFYISNNQTKICAKASLNKTRTFSTVSISGHFVLFLKQCFQNDSQAGKEIIKSYISDTTKFIEGESGFQFFMASHFIIYHEIAHLLHFKNPQFSDIHELTSDDPTFKLDNHILEFDADEFSAICAGAHLLQYTESLEYSNNEEFCKSLKDYCIISISAIFSVLLQLHPNFEEFYTKKMSHPHPLSRMVSISMNLIEYLNQNIRKMSIEFNHSEITKEAASLANQYNVMLFGNKSLEKTHIMLNDQQSAIMNYFSELSMQKIDGFVTAIEEWNLNSTQ